jgi:hypothetical protein
MDRDSMDCRVKPGNDEFGTKPMAESAAGIVHWRAGAAD